MIDRRDSKVYTWTLGSILFVAIKVAGHSFAAWSWWWLVLPIVPLLGLLIQRCGL